MRPDWKNDGAYAYVKNLSNSAIAFEFLRRNEDYQADFHDYKSIFNVVIQ